MKRLQNYYFGSGIFDLERIPSMFLFIIFGHKKIIIRHNCTPIMHQLYFLFFFSFIRKHTLYNSLHFVFKYISIYPLGVNNQVLGCGPCVKFVLELVANCLVWTCQCDNLYHEGNLSQSPRQGLVKVNACETKEC